MDTDLEAISICGREGSVHLSITAGVHGDEPEPMEAVRRLARCIDPQELLGRVTLVPVVNRPAERLGRRVADDGLDLARVCPGKRSGSVTERIAWELSQLIRTADAYIDLHTGGAKYTIWPMSGYMLHRDEKILRQQRAMARAFNLPVVWGTDPSLDGRSLSVARDANIPAIYCEYLGADTYHTEAVDALVEGCLNVMGHLGMIPRSSPPSRVRWMAEDTAPGSGHLQIAHAAPVAGTFIGLRELGSYVALGEVLGRIEDSASGESCSVLAETNGYLLAMHLPGPVACSEGVAVVVPFEICTN